MSSCVAVLCYIRWESPCSFELWTFLISCLSRRWPSLLLFSLIRAPGLIWFVECILFLLIESSKSASSVTLYWLSSLSLFSLSTSFSTSSKQSSVQREELMRFKCSRWFNDVSYRALTYFCYWLIALLVPVAVPSTIKRTTPANWLWGSTHLTSDIRTHSYYKNFPFYSIFI